MIGHVVIVSDAITGGNGRVRVGDGTWPASGHDAPVGTAVRIVGVADGTLLVELAEPHD